MGLLTGSTMVKLTVQVPLPGSPSLLLHDSILARRHEDFTEGLRDLQTLGTGPVSKDPKGDPKEGTPKKW